MKRPFRRKNLLGPPRDVPDTTDLINRVQQQLSAIEKKLDILISQSSRKPFEKSYVRQEHGFRERTYTRIICADCGRESEIPFKPKEGRPVYCKECFSKRKRGNQFNASRDNRPEEIKISHERRSDKREPKERQRHGKKKRSFFERKKKRAN